MHKNTSLQFTLIFCILLVSACTDKDPGTHKLPIEYQTLKLFPSGKKFSGYQLTDQNGALFDPQRFRNKISVVFFGFTHCPDICPTTLTDMQAVYKAIDKTGLEPPQFVFVSVDPERDDVQSLKSYINYFNEKFIAATGDAANILSITSQLGVAYKIEEHEPGEINYNVDHSAALFVINNQAERMGIFTAPHNTQSIAKDLITLIKKS